MTVHDRYQVADSFCGLISAVAKRAEAFGIAQAHRASDRCRYVEVFDVMARYDAPQTWDTDGVVIGHRQSKADG